MKYKYILGGDSPDFVPALICEERKFFFFKVYLGALLRQHDGKSFLLVEHEVRQLDLLLGYLERIELFLGEAAPLGEVSILKVLLLLVSQPLLLLHIRVFNLLSSLQDLLEAFPLIVLEF